MSAASSFGFPSPNPFKIIYIECNTTTIELEEANCWYFITLASGFSSDVLLIPKFEQGNWFGFLNDDLTTNIYLKTYNDETPDKVQIGEGGASIALCFWNPNINKLQCTPYLN